MTGDRPRVRPAFGAQRLRNDEGEALHMAGVYVTGHRFGIGRFAVSRLDLRVALVWWELSVGLTNLPARRFGVPPRIAVQHLDEFERERLANGCHLFRWPVKGHPDEGRAVGVTVTSGAWWVRLLWRKPKPRREWWLR